MFIYIKCHIKLNVVNVPYYKSNIKILFIIFKITLFIIDIIDMLYLMIDIQHKLN